MKPIRYDRRFVKVFRKRIAPNAKLEQQFQSRLKLFVAGKRDSPLNDHALSGPMRGQRAFWITGDVRVVYI